MKRKRGFTLIELLVVIAIIGVLSAVVLAFLGDARARSRDTSRMATVREVQKALQVYWTQNGAYPGPAFPINLTDLTQPGYNFVPAFISRIDYSTTNVSNPLYFRLTQDSYAIYVSLEKSPSCKTGIGSIDFAFPGLPRC